VSAAFRQRATWLHHFVLAALCVITAINYIQRNSIAGAETTIRKALVLDISQTGDAIGAFFLAYALFQIPSGWLAQKLTPRWALTLYALGWSVATGVCALAAGAATLVGARLVMGALQAGIFPCATMILLVWYPSNRRALATAILNSFMLIGSAVGSMLTGVLLGPIGWRSLFVIYALPGLVWAIWFAWWFRNRPSEHPGVNAAELELLDSDPSKQQEVSELKRQEHNAPPERAATPLLAIFLSWPLLFLCLQQFCRAGASRFFDTWLSTYLQEARGQLRDEANLLTSAPLWAAVIGGPVGGWVSDAVLQVAGSRRAGRQGVAIASLLMCCVCYAGAYLMPNVYAAVAMVSVGYFIFTFSAPCAYALSMDMSGRNLGVVFGTMNMVGNFGSLAFTWFSPRLKTWSGDWTLPVMVFAGMHLAAAFFWLLLNPEGLIGEPRPKKGVLAKEEEEIDAAQRMA
jgi:MFS family permease